MTVDYLMTLFPDDTEIQLMVLTPHGNMLGNGYITLKELKAKDDDDNFYMNFMNNEVITASVEDKAPLTDRQKGILKIVVRLTSLKENRDKWSR